MRSHSLRNESTGRAMSRMRFISTFKRDHLRDQFDTTFNDSETIKASNSEAHDSDPVGDADLYLQFKRCDEDAYKVLYGLTPLHIGALRSKCHLIPQLWLTLINTR